MAQPQPDISSLLAMLQRSVPTQPQAQQPPAASSHVAPPYPAPLPAPQHSGAVPGFPLPQPTNSGSLDISGIQPVNTGSVNFSDTLAKARGIAAEKGVSYDSGRNSAAPGRDPRIAARNYRRSRSRSRSPPRQQYRDAYNANPYRDERRNDRGREDTQNRGSPMQERGPFSPRNDFSGRTRSPDRGGTDGNSELIVIDSSLVGLVIGRNGENLRRVEQETGTRIQFMTGPEPGARDRQCRVSGNPRARIEAIREINRIIDENGGSPVKQMSRSNQAAVAKPKDGSNHPALREGENSIQMLVPDKTVGLIIGRGGETIRDLQEKSGCHINIVGENKSINGRRPVNLIGSKSAASLAQRLIEEIVDSDTRVGGSSQQQDGGHGFDNFAAMDSRASGPSSGAGDKASENIFVPSDAVGMIIGKGGETIKDMQNQTGCKINVTQPKHPDIEREVGLIGTRYAIEAAKRAIFEKVDSVRQRDAAHRSSRGGDREGGDHYGGLQQYSQAQQQPSYGPPAVTQPSAPQGMPQPIAQSDSNATDPYAMWGGYANYVNLWYAMTAQQNQQNNQNPGSGAPGAPGAPGT